MEVANDIYTDILSDMFIKAKEVLDSHPIYKVYDLTANEIEAVKNKIVDFIESEPLGLIEGFVSTLKDE